MSGYIYEFDVYQGKNSKDNSKEFDLGGSVVKKLTTSLKEKGFIIYMDNLYTDPDLFEYLKSVGISAYGTVCPKRKYLPNLRKDKELKRGEFDCKFTKQGLGFFKWMDQVLVYLLSNYYGNEVSTMCRKLKDGKLVNILAPTIVKDYNAFMGWAERGDMLKAFYDRNHKSKKFWHPLFFGFLEIVLINAYVVYWEIYGRISLFDFKRHVTLGLLAKGKLPTKNKGRPRDSTTENSPFVTPPKCYKKKVSSVSNDIRLENRGAHWPEFVSRRGRCEFCASKKIQSKPYAKCVLCKVYLCINDKKNCFYEYHHV